MDYKLIQIQSEIMRVEHEITRYEQLLENPFLNSYTETNIAELEERQKEINENITSLTSHYINQLVDNIIEINLINIHTFLVSSDTQKTCIPVELSTEIKFELSKLFQSEINNMMSEAAIYSNAHTGEIKDVKLEVSDTVTGLKGIFSANDEQRNKLLRVIDDKLHEMTKGVLSEDGIGIKEALANPEYLKFSENEIIYFRTLEGLKNDYIKICQDIGLYLNLENVHKQNLELLKQTLEELRQREKEIRLEHSIIGKIKKLPELFTSLFFEQQKKDFIQKKENQILGIFQLTPLQIRLYNNITDSVDTINQIRDFVLQSLEKLKVLPVSELHSDKKTEAVQQIITQGTKSINEISKNIKSDIQETIDSISIDAFEKAPDSSGKISFVDSAKKAETKVALFKSKMKTITKLVSSVKEEWASELKAMGVEIPNSKSKKEAEKHQTNERG